MKKIFSPMDMVRMLLIILYVGIQVLWFEIRWLAGPDFVFWERLRAMRRQRDALHEKVARLSTLADPRCEQVNGDLALLEKDLQQLEIQRQHQRLAGLRALQARLPADFLENGASV